MNHRTKGILPTALMIVALGGPVTAASAQADQPDRKQDLVFSDAGQPRRVAVLDFRVIGEHVDPAAGEVLASVIRSALIRADNLQVIEREEIAAVLREQDFQMTDMVDPATAIEIGRIAGVDLLVMGSVAHLGKTYTVTSRVVDVASGEAAEAEEFELTSLDAHTRLGRLLAALIGEQPITPDSIATEPRLTESFDGKDCKLRIGPLKDPRNHTTLEKGRYLMNKATPGNHYWWVPGVKGDFYAQVDLAQLEGPEGAACGLVWGMRGTGDYLSVVIGKGGRVWIERRQGGTTSTVLTEQVDWPILNDPPRSNRIRLESWDDRHRVFINGVCLDDFYEPGYREGKLGLRASLPNRGGSARFAADNLVAGALRPGKADIVVQGRPTRKTTKQKVGEPGLVDTRPREKVGEPGLVDDRPGRKKGDRPKVVGRRPKIKRRPRSAGASADIASVRPHLEVIKGTRGVAVHLNFKVYNLKGQHCQTTVLFADARTGQALEDRDGHYHTDKGQVSVVRNFVPKYRKSTYGEFTLFIPLAQLHLSRGQTNLKCRVAVWNHSYDPPRALAVSQWVPFNLSK